MYGVNGTNGNAFSAVFAFALNNNRFFVLINDGVMRANIITLTARDTAFRIYFIIIGRSGGSRQFLATVN